LQYFCKTKQMKNMRTTNKDMDVLYDYLTKRGASLNVDRNPSAEKINRIKEAIKSKNEYFSKAIEKFSSINSANVNN